MKQTVITIDDKRIYTGSAFKHPEGDFYATDGAKYTCWDSDLFSTYNIGDVVIVDFTEKTNDTGEKVYINKNISKMCYHSSTDEQVSSNIRDVIESNNAELIVSQGSELECGNFTYRGIKYEVIVRIAE